MLTAAAVMGCFHHGMPERLELGQDGVYTNRALSKLGATESPGCCKEGVGNLGLMSQFLLCALWVMAVQSLLVYQE